MPHEIPLNVINSIIGETSVFKGDVEIRGLLRIDGTYQGAVKSNHRVLIGAQGRAKGSIHAKEVVIGGAFKGDIYAEERVIIYNSGLVIGTIYAPSITVEEGAALEGYCCITPRLKEEGVRPVQGQNTYTLKIDPSRRIPVPTVPLSPTLGE